MFLLFGFFLNAFPNGFNPTLGPRKLILNFRLGTFHNLVPLYNWSSLGSLPYLSLFWVPLLNHGSLTLGLALILMLTALDTHHPARLSDLTCP